MFRIKQGMNLVDLFIYTVSQKYVDNCFIHTIEITVNLTDITIERQYVIICSSM